jgi:hypothetical protein
MTIRILAIVIRALWFVAEKTHAPSHKVKPAGDWDKSSLTIWIAADLTIPLGVIIGFTARCHIQHPRASKRLQRTGISKLLPDNLWRDSVVIRR